MTTIVDRTGIRLAIIDRINEVSATTFDTDATKVTAFYSHPGDELPDRAIVAGEMTGTQNLVTFGGPRPGRQDNCTLVLGFVAYGYPTPEAGLAVVQAMVDMACEALFVSPFIDGHIANAELSPGRLDGPNAFPDSGDSLVCEAVLEVNALVTTTAS